MLAPIRLTNAAALFLPVLPTPLRGYCCAVRQNERQLPCGSGETQGDASPLHSTPPPPLRGLSNGSHIGMRGSRNRRHWRLYWSRYRRPRLCDVTFGVLMILDNTMSMSLQLVDEKSRERFSSRGAYTYDHQSAGERSVSRHCSAESP